MCIISSSSAWLVVAVFEASSMWIFPAHVMLHLEMFIFAIRTGCGEAETNFIVSQFHKVPQFYSAALIGGQCLLFKFVVPLPRAAPCLHLGVQFNYQMERFLRSADRPCKHARNYVCWLTCWLYWTIHISPISIKYLYLRHLLLIGSGLLESLAIFWQEVLLPTLTESFAIVS